MNEDERYLFDLNGYLVVRKALGADEVAECNRAIEHHSDELTEIDQSLVVTPRRSRAPPAVWDWAACWPGNGPGLIAMNEGCEGHSLHGGGVERPNLSEAYFFKADRIYTGLTVVELLLADEGPGDGGIAVVPGSHKADLPCPSSMMLGNAYQEHVLEANARREMR